ncbi:MAG: histidine kinase [Pseudomonadota bacterium]|nr:histidine kinase [Pseudomonadota bacterium]
MIKSLFFVLRLCLAWAAVVFVVAILWSELPLIGWIEWPVVIVAMITMALVVAGALSHLGRVRLIAGRIDKSALANRQRRQIEIPFEAGEAFDLLDAAIRELPRIQHVESARDSLQVRAKLARPDNYGERARGRWNPLLWFGVPRNQILATVTPGHDSGSVTLICEPENPAWSDWFLVDDGTNLENAEAITRAITRRVAERRRNEKADAAQTSTEKELTVAKLSLLHAQVEPHFLYNTLASAQLLTRSDPARADEMLGHLIQYLRHSLPRADDEVSTLGAELERALAYLEILRIRMGPRLSVQVDVPESLRRTPLPPMMLQTLVENAIKHGLEPRTAGGTVWIRARRSEGAVAVTVADDGDGFNTRTRGTGIGLKNVRERLRLMHGSEAALAVVANFPAGVAATITVPASAPSGAASAPGTVGSSADASAAHQQDRLDA